MSSGSDIDFVKYVGGLQTLKFVDTATLAMLALEYIATIPLEVKLIWPTRISFIKIFYFLNRHVVWISVVTARLVNSPECMTMNMVQNCSRVVTVLVSEGLLFTRVWALSGNNRRLGVFLLAFWLVLGIAAFGLIVVYALGARFEASPFPLIAMCIPTHSDSKYSTPALALIFIEQIVIMSLSFFYGIRRRGIAGSRLGQIVLRDGLFYFVALTVIAVLNILLQLTVKGSLKTILNTFHFAMHAILCNRLVLHLRQEAREHMGFTTQWNLGSLGSSAGPLREDQNAQTMSLRTMRHME